jgi:hypothetical protein
VLDWQEGELQSAEREQAEEERQEVEEAWNGSEDMLIARVKSIRR